MVFRKSREAYRAVHSDRIYVIYGGRAMTNRKNGSKTDARDKRGRFGPGNPGRPAGARNRATAVAAVLLDGEAGALARKAVELALSG